MVLGSKGHGRSTLLRFLKFNKLVPATSSASTFFMRSLFNPEWNEEPHITNITGIYDIYCTIHFMFINAIESGITSPIGSLDIGLWSCNFLDGQKPHKKSSIPNEKSISFCTWDFAGDVSSAIKLWKS